MSRLLLLPPTVGGVPNQPAYGQVIVATGSGNKVVGFRGRHVIAAGGLPMFVAPTGTMANNGAITLGTAIALAYPNCYVLLPANAIAAGSAAGWYFCQMSSTTVGTVFNNTYTTGLLTIPASPTAFVTTGPGAYTGLTGTQVGFQISMPGNTMGPNGGLIVTALYSNNNSAGTKAFPSTLGGAVFGNPANTTNIGVLIYREVWNRGVTNQQVTMPASAAAPGATSVALFYTLARDTTAALTIGLGFNNNTATDWAALESFQIEVIPG